MSIAEVLEQLPSLTPEERELIVRRVLELDDDFFSPEDEKLIEKRMAEHRANPASAVPFDEMFARLRARFCK
jgi:putative addiction module component (TIGR02574 family)